MLERLVKENEEKEVRIKLHKEKIARSPRKLERRPARSIAKSSESEEEERTPVQSETSDEEVHSKKCSKLKNGRSSSLLIIEQIQYLIANAVTQSLAEVRIKPLHQTLNQES